MSLWALMLFIGLVAAAWAPSRAHGAAKATEPVITVLVPNEKVKAKQAEGMSLPLGLSDTDAPIRITSDTIEADERSGLVSFKGGINARQGTASLVARELDVYYDLKGGNIEKLEAVGNVSLARDDRRASGDKLKYELATQRLALVGGASISRGKNVIKGHRIIFDSTNGHGVVTEKGKANVSSIFYPRSKAAAGKKKRPGLTSGGPVHVSARRLEVFEGRKEAVYSGGVKVEQGEMEIHSKSLVIKYRADESDIDRITASGGVRVLAGGREASSEKAVYYRGDERIVLNGKAKIQQGRSSISGNQITYFPTKGIFRVEGVGSSNARAKITQ